MVEALTPDPLISMCNAQLDSLCELEARQRKGGRVIAGKVRISSRHAVLTKMKGLLRIHLASWLLKREAMLGLRERSVCKNR